MKLSEGMKRMLVDAYEDDAPTTPPGPVRSALMRRGLVLDYTSNRVGHLTPEGKKVAKAVKESGPIPGQEVTVHYGAERLPGIITAVRTDTDPGPNGQRGRSETVLEIVLLRDVPNAKRREGNSL